MNHPGEPHPLSPVQHNVPVLNTPLAAHSQDFERDAHDIDIKGYFNIL